MAVALLLGLIEGGRTPTPGPWRYRGAMEFLGKEGYARKIPGSELWEVTEEGHAHAREFIYS